MYNNPPQVLKLLKIINEIYRENWAIFYYVKGAGVFRTGTSLSINSFHLKNHSGLFHLELDSLSQTSTYSTHNTDTWLVRGLVLLMAMHSILILIGVLEDNPIPRVATSRRSYLGEFSKSTCDLYLAGVFLPQVHSGNPFLNVTIYHNTCHRDEQEQYIICGFSYISVV